MSAHHCISGVSTNVSWFTIKGNIFFALLAERETHS